MPYDLEKGPYFSVVEDFLSDHTRAVDTLLSLRGGVDVVHLGVLESPSLNPDGRTPLDRARHLNEDWFGMSWDAQQQKWHRQPPPSCPPPPPPPTTGFWQNWYGDAEAIFRETMIRAIEVSLGVDHGHALASGGTTPRHWPIELFWKCQGPWFEGWVTWRRHGNGDHDGQVTVIMATPGNGSPIWRTPRRSPPVDEYEENPVTAPGDQGMWVITHEHEDQAGGSAPLFTAFTPHGQMPIPLFGAAFAGCGDVIVVSPAERDGGVNAYGRAYTPPAAPPVPAIPEVLP